MPKTREHGVTYTVCHQETQKKNEILQNETTKYEF